MKWPLSAFADEAGGQIDEQIKALHREGIDRIDLRGVNGHNITVLPLDLAEEIRAKLDAAGVTVQMYGSPIGKIDIADDVQSDLDRLTHLGKLKPILGCGAVRFFSYYNKTELPENQWRDKCLENMARLMEVAERYDLVLYHENERHIFGDLVRNVCVLRDECHAKNPGRFKMIFDFDNYNQSGEDVWAAWQELGPTTEAIHFKDSKRLADGSYQHVPAGTGDGHIPRILQTLADRGWNGPLTLEPHLTHSAMVLTTGSSGEGDKALKDLPPAETFHIAAEHALAILKDVGRWA